MASGEPADRILESVVTHIYGGGMSDLPVEIIRSKRRRRTVQATFVEGKLRVRVPDGLHPDEEDLMVRQVTERAARKVSSRHIDLARRAVQLAAKYGLDTPESVVWSSRQMKRWGSCTTEEGRIRISDRLADMPPWVLDSVLVHELAHLREANHGPRFQEIVGRYELNERAIGYLMAKQEEPWLSSKADSPMRPGGFQLSD